MTRYLLIFVLFFPLLVKAQKVGLVLSGGAAKGLAHVGVLKALEENEIPVDYIVGTSMGGIIGGCYAAGMSPSQIESMVLSGEFIRWVNGLPEQGYNYFYHQNDVSPSFIKLSLGLDSTFNFQFNSSIANDVSLNFVLAEKMAEASAISGSNFDSLFIPLRVVAADIFTQNEVILSKGSLSDALRATQTVPFFYDPIRVDGKYLFDGGVYNNFPIDVAQRDFKPDVIIGVNVSTKIFDEYPYEKDEKLISQSLLFLLLDKSDPSQIPENGVYIQPNIQGYTSFDFGRAKGLIDSGYAQTMRQMDEIKSKINARHECDSVAERRNAFNSRSVPLLFDGLTFSGFNSKQRGYIRRSFRKRKGDPIMHYSDIKKGYFTLVSQDYFSNVYPSILYNEEKNTFNLRLSRRPQQNFQVDFGGVIASRDISNIFLGLNYYHFNRTLTDFNMAFQTGSFYKSALARVRIDFPKPLYLEPFVAFDSWDYFENNDVFRNASLSSTATVLKRLNRRAAIRIGIPIREFFKSVLHVEGFNNMDRYTNGDIFVSTDTLDRLRLKGFKAGVTFSANTLNRKQYASAGKSFSFIADYFNVRETYTPGNTSFKNEEVKIDHQWFRLKATAEQYFGSKRFRSGYYAEAVFSNQPSFQNYFGTIVNAPAFLPLQDSRTLILENFRSFNYVAGGLRNIVSLRSKLDLRLEGYLFKPFDYLQQNEEQEADISRDLKSIFFVGTAGLVYHSPIGPISLNVNYYDDTENQLGVLLHAGFLLFNKHSLE
jgi:NTE family protein